MIKLHSFVLRAECFSHPFVNKFLFSLLFLLESRSGVFTMTEKCGVFTMTDKCGVFTMTDKCGVFTMTEKCGKRFIKVTFCADADVFWRCVWFVLCFFVGAESTCQAALAPPPFFRCVMSVCLDALHFRHFYFLASPADVWMNSVWLRNTWQENNGESWHWSTGGVCLLREMLKSTYSSKNIWLYATNFHLYTIWNSTSQGQGTPN